MTDQNFPLISYSPDKGPLEWGTSHGESFRPAIKELVEIRKELMLARSPKLKDSLGPLAIQQMKATEAMSVPLAMELKGIAEGADISLTDIVILNNYTDFRDIDLPDEGCSTLHVQDNDKAYAGQTWDMHGSAQKYVCAINIPQTSYGPAQVIFSLVGCVGMMGHNSYGNFIGVNNINTAKAKTGVIWPALVRHVLGSKTHKQMKDRLLNSEVTSGHNYILSTAQGGEHWEVTPSTQECVAQISKGSEGVAFHTNHCLGPETKKLEDPKSISSTTHVRYELLEKKAHKDLSFEGAYKLLTDHEGYPKSICSHFESGAQDPSMTCGGGLVDFQTSKVRLWRGCETHGDNFRQMEFILSQGNFQALS